MVNPVKTPIEQGLISRIVSGAKYIFTGRADWFGPGEPIPSVVQDQVAAGTEGRGWDYPVAVNKTIQPRQNEPVQYSQLRSLADNCDLLRLAIETRKDQICRLSWKIKAQEGKRVPQKRIDALAAIFRRPDREKRWRRWLRALLEDYYVLDAVTIYPRRTKGGDLYSLDLIDGSTIKRNIALDGRTPMPPAAAYQQILHGVVAAEYTVEQLLYLPRNMRTHKLYGFSHTEMIWLMVNIALRRQLSHLEYFTEGNVPEGIATCPEGWQTNQVAEWQKYWDALCEGNQAIKRKIKWVHAGMEYKALKTELIKNDFDEWLSRVIQYCFSLSPMPYVRQMNRASGEIQQDTATEEGQEVDKVYIKEIVDDVLELHLDAGDCEFEWVQEKDVDPFKQAQVDEIYINTGVQTPQQIAEARGFEYEPEEEPEPEVQPQPQPGIVPDDEKLAKTAGAGKDKKFGSLPIGKRTKKARKKLIRILTDFFAEESARIAADISESLQLKKAAGEKKTPEDALNQLSFEGWQILWEPVSQQLATAVEEAGLATLKQIGIKDEGITELVHEQAVQVARERAAEMVGMKYVDGELVPNPNPRWAITDSTRDMLRETITKSLEEGPTAQELAKAIEESAAFDGCRAEMVARTELANAHSQGTLESYRAAERTGVVLQKRWLVGSGDSCDTCQANAAAGAIGVNEVFPSGHDAPTAHPHCTCSLAPVVVSASEVQSGEEPYK